MNLKILSGSQKAKMGLAHILSTCRGSCTHPKYMWRVLQHPQLHVEGLAHILSTCAHILEGLAYIQNALHTYAS